LKEKEKDKVKKAKDKVELQKAKEKESMAKAKEKEKGKKKKKDDDGKPSRPPSAYTFYFSSRIAELRKQKPDSDVPSLAKQIGKEWNDMTDGNKRQFNKKAEEARKDYDERMETYQKSLPPKKPASSFMLFSGEVRQSVLKQNPKLSATDVAKALGQQWKQLTPQKKKRFEDKAVQLREQWQKEMEKRAKKADKAEKAQ